MAQQKEARLVNEWLMLKHPKALQWRRVRLGPLPTKELSGMYKVTLRWVDAIYIEDGRVNLVEAKLKPDLGAIAQLETYRDLFVKTPEFTEYHGSPINLVFLTIRRDPVMEEQCARREIRYEIYAPDWIFQLQAERRRG